jgi:cation-transporting P-type ATPase E
MTKSTFSGLTEAQVQERRKQGRVNSTTTKPSRTYWQITLENVFNAINILLFLIALALVLIGRYSDAFVYIAVVVLNMLVGLVQEIKAKLKLDSIATLTRPKAHVIRSGQELEIETSQIVEGDLLVVGSGDLIPADGQIVKGKLDLDESLLTGESDLMPRAVSEKVYAGSVVVTGQAYFVAEKIGDVSLANQITANAKTYRRRQTPIQKEINLFIRVLFLVAFLIGALLTLGSVLTQSPVEESLQIAAVVLGIIPNSLVVMINLAYAVGGVNLLGRGALIQQLNAVESLSNVDVLCLDKTGTLTTNRLLIEKITTKSGSETKVKQWLGDFCASLTDLNKTTQTLLNHTPGRNLEVETEIPFNSAYKWSGLTFKLLKLKEKSTPSSLILGAPEVLAQHLNLTPEQTEQTLKAQNKGHRVLYFVGSDNQLQTPLNPKQPVLPPGLELLAIINFKSEIRSEAARTLAEFKRTGVDLKIISGDSPYTVKALATQIGLGQDLKVISGPEIDKLDQTAFSQIALEYDIFGRITPDQKRELVKTLRQNGKYVGMVGDGVNDVLALKQAHLAISMESGSQASRSVADIILLKNSFASLPVGLLEGQKIRHSLENIFQIYMIRVIYITFLILAASLAALAFPFTVKQSSLISILTAGLPALGLTLWARPQKPHKHGLIRSVLHFVLPASLTLAVFSTILFAGFSYVTYFNLINQFPTSAFSTEQIIRLTIDNALPTVRTVLTTFIILSGLILTGFVTPRFKWLAGGNQLSKDWRPTLLAFSLAVFYLLLLYYQPWRDFWDLAPLDGLYMLVILATTLAWAVTLQLFWRYRVFDRFLNLRLLPSK